MASYIGVAPPEQTGIVERYRYTGDGSTTVFSGADVNGHTLVYTSTNPLLVFLNGVQLIEDVDFTKSSNTSVTFTTAPASNDDIELLTFGSFNLNAPASLRDQLEIELSSGEILVGNSSNQSAKVTPSGDATISNTGVITVASAAGNFNVTDSLTFSGNGSASTPLISLGDTDTGIYRNNQGNYINFTHNSSNTWVLGNDFFQYQPYAAGPALRGELASSTNPTVTPYRGDSNTGIGADGSDGLYLITGGATGLTVDSSQNVTIANNLTVDTNTLHVDSTNNKVGIGTTTPGQTLTIFGGSSTALNLISTTGGVSSVFFGDQADIVRGAISFNNSTNKLSLNGYNNTERLTILSDGKIGIGTTSPSTLLHLSSSDPQITLTDTDGTGSQVIKASGDNLRIETSNIVQFQADNAGSIQLLDSTTYYGKIFRSGGFKIESVVADQDFFIRGNDGGVFFDALSFDMSEAGAATFNDKVTIPGDLTVDTDTLYVDSTNNRVGIGTTSPGSGLHLAIDGGDAELLLERTSVGFTSKWGIKPYADKLHFRDQAASPVVDLFTMTSDGYFGIGETSPETQLHITGSIAFGTDTVTNHQGGVISGLTKLVFADNDANGTAHGRLFNASNVFNAQAGTSGFKILRANGTTDMVIDSSGRIGIGDGAVINTSYRLTISDDSSTGSVAGLTLRNTQTGENDDFGIYTYASNFYIRNLTDATNVLTIDTSNNVSITNNLTVGGNLTVNGTTTTVNTTNTTIADNLLELNSGAAANTNDAGIIIERGSTGDNAIMAWDESEDEFIFGTTTATASDTGNLTITAGNINVGSITTTGVDLGDNEYIRLGASQDLQLYHDASNSYIKDAGTGDLRIEGSFVRLVDTSNSHTTATFASNAVVLRYNNIAKLTTTGAGATITGSLNVAGTPLAIGNDNIQVDFSAPEGRIQSKNSTGSPASNLGLYTTDTGGTTNKVVHINYQKRIGVGTTSPDATLDIQPSEANLGIKIRRHNASSQYIHISETDGARHLIEAIGDKEFRIFNEAPNNPTTFFTNSTERMRIDESGNVGIGTSSPSYKAHIQGTDGISASIRAEATGTDSDAFIVTDNDANVWTMGIDGDSSDSWMLSNAFGLSSPKITVTTGGNVGIGISSPQTALDLAGEINLSGLTASFPSNSQPRIYRSGSSAGAYPFNNFGHLIIQSRGDGDNRDIIFATGTAGANKTVINSSGNIGINTTSPQYELHVNSSANADIHLTNDTVGTSASDGLTITMATNSNASINNRENANLIFSTNNSEAMRITSTGRLGIGTTNPSTELHIATTGDPTITLEDTSGLNQLRIRYNATGLSWVSGIHGGENAFKISENATFGTNDYFTVKGTTGYVGIGTTTPSALLDVAATSASTIQVRNTGTVSSILLYNGSTTNQIYSRGINSSTGRDLSFFQGSSEVMRITSTGRLGIGTTSPSYLLDLYGNPGNNAGALLRLESSITDDNGIIHEQADGTKWFTGQETSNPNDYEFWNYNGSTWSAKLHIGTDGNVGIGTTSPQEHLSINVALNDTEGLGLQYLTETKGGIKLSPSGGEIRMGAFNSTGTYFTTLYSNNAERMRIASTGQVSITGTTTAFDTTASVNGLQAYYETDSGLATLGSYSSGGNTSLTFHTNASGNASIEKMRIDSSGNVGIGTSSPSGKLNVKIPFNSQDGLILSYNDTYPVGGITAQGSTGEVRIGAFNTQAGSAYFPTFYSDNSEAMRITLAGNVGIGTTSPDYKLQVDGDIVPETDNTYDLGKSTLAWANIYTGDLHLSNEKKTKGNDIDGTKGNWTVQEGETDLFLINNKSGKKYKFKLEEIE